MLLLHHSHITKVGRFGMSSWGAIFLWTLTSHDRDYSTSNRNVLQSHRTFWNIGGSRLMTNFIGFSSSCMSHKFLPEHFTRPLDDSQCSTPQKLFALAHARLLLKRPTFGMCKRCMTCWWCASIILMSSHGNFHQVDTIKEQAFHKFPRYDCCSCNWSHQQSQTISS